MSSTAAPVTNTSPLLAVRARLAGSLLSLFGLRPNPRRARWLATTTAHAAGRHTDNRAIAESARRRLTSVTQGALLRHRASRDTAPRIAGLRAEIPTLAQGAEEAASNVTRLEAMVPSGAIVESPSWLLRSLLAMGLAAEAFITFGSLGSTPLADSPIALFCSSLAAAPMAAALLSRAGATIRRSFWRQHVIFADIGLVLLALTVATVLGVGLTLSRVGDIHAGRAAAMATSAGLQSLILALPLVDGYLHALPVPGLQKARRVRDRSIRRHDARLSELHRLEAEHAQHEVKLITQAEAAHAEFEATLLRLGANSVALSPYAQLGHTQISGKIS